MEFSLNFPSTCTASFRVLLCISVMFSTYCNVKMKTLDRDKLLATLPKHGVPDIVFVKKLSLIPSCSNISLKDPNITFNLAPDSTLNHQYERKIAIIIYSGDRFKAVRGRSFPLITQDLGSEGHRSSSSQLTFTSII